MLKEMVDEILVKHHEPTRMLLEKIKTLLYQAANEMPDSDLLNKLGMSFQSLSMSMQMHMEKEEQCLFPMMQRMEEGFDAARFAGGIGNPIVVMESEHKDLDACFERLHRLTNRFTTTVEMPVVLGEIYQALTDLEKDLKIHSTKEEKELFPAAKEKERAFAERL